MTTLARVVNTAPLIFLAKLGRLKLLRLGTESVYVPSIVLGELRTYPDEASLAVHDILGSWLVERNSSRSDLLKLASQALDPGEAAVIALALELGTPDVVLDDQDARRFAFRSGLHPIGTLGLLLAGNTTGIVPAVAPEIEKLLQAGFRATEELVARILAEAGE